VCGGGAAGIGRARSSGVCAQCRVADGDAGGFADREGAAADRGGQVAGRDRGDAGWHDGVRGEPPVRDADPDRCGDAAGRAAGAEDEGDHIVLGKSIGLEERAAQIGGRTLMNDPDWQATLTKAIADPGTKISVALDDVGGASTFGRVMGAVQRGASGLGSPFDWEMQQLYSAGQLGSTDFMREVISLTIPLASASATPSATSSLYRSRTSQAVSSENSAGPQAPNEVPPHSFRAT
jgi:hypothetical protein